MAAIFVVLFGFIVCLALPVTSNGNDLNAHSPAYLPGIIQDVWHVSNSPGAAEVHQPHTFGDFASDVLMQYDIQGLLERRNTFSLRIMNSSWTDPADTNVFHKGEALYLQASVSPGPGQQLYVQSCHASSSPNPSDKPEVSLIINKGCVASKESLVRFVLRQSDAVDFVVRTSVLKSSKTYIHCRVYLSDVGLTAVTKFCNYNKLKSRWVDLGGQSSVCDCCGRRCTSIERVQLPVSLDLNAVVSTGQLIIKDQKSAPQATSPPPSDYSTTKSRLVTRDLPEKRWIRAGASFSGPSMQNIGNVSPLPVQPGFGGGVVIISQGLGGDLSMWLPDIMELEVPPVVQVGIGYSENPVDVSLQSDELFGNQMQDEGTVKMSQAVAVDEGKAKEVIDSQSVAEGELGVRHFKDVDDSHKIQEKLAVTEAHHFKQPQMDLDFAFPSNDRSLVNPTTPHKLSESADKGDVVFRQAEMVFKGTKRAKSLEPVLYSKLSLKQAADGSSSLNYEEQRRPSMREQDETPQLEQDGEKRPKDEQMEEAPKIKGLVSSLLDELRSMDWF